MLTAVDCDDADAASTTQATDGDCDGVLTAADCNDQSATSTTRATDGDCDGVLTAQDCDDTDATALSTAPVAFSLQNAFARPPANVTLFFRATQCGDAPVAGLAAEAFSVRENGASVSVFESGQTLLSTSLGFERFSLLLLDMSGSTIASGALPSLLSAAEAFINATVVDGGSHRVGIQLFDGRQFPVDVIEYTNDVVDLQAAIDGLSGYVVVDSSTNLNGAVIAALADVDAKLAASQAGAKSSALVVFTDGTDQTAYFTTDQAVTAVNASPSAVFTVGLGAELDANALRRIGKSGAEFAAEQADIVTAFTAIGAALEREAGGYYILSYCSPKRAGSHTLTVAVDGRPGQASYTFNATGFSAGCTPEGVSDPCANRECGVVDGIVCGACSGEATCTLTGECVVTPSDVCGDGARTTNEACDDDNTDGGDGCNANCTAIEGGFTCPAQGGACSAICGDGLTRGNEACDDDNSSNTGRCSQCECIRGYVEDGNGGCISDPDTEPDWTLILTAPLNTQPEGSVAMNGGFGGQGPATFGGSACWNQTSDWNYLWIPHPRPEAARIRVEVDVFANTSSWGLSVSPLVDGPRYIPDTYVVNGVGIYSAHDGPTTVWQAVNYTSSQAGEYQGSIQQSGSWVTLRQDIDRTRLQTSLYREGQRVGTWPVLNTALVGDKILLNSGVPFAGSHCWRSLKVSIAP